jgi:hypothetical protein
MGIEEPDMREVRNVDISDFTLYDAGDANARRIYITRRYYLSRPDLVISQVILLRGS